MASSRNAERSEWNRGRLHSGISTLAIEGALQGAHGRVEHAEPDVKGIIKTGIRPPVEYFLERVGWTKPSASTSKAARVATTAVRRPTGRPALAEDAVAMAPSNVPWPSRPLETFLRLINLIDLISPEAVSSLSPIRSFNVDFAGGGVVSVALPLAEASRKLLPSPCRSKPPDWQSGESYHPLLLLTRNCDVTIIHSPRCVR